MKEIHFEKDAKKYWKSVERRVEKLKPPKDIQRSEQRFKDMIVQSFLTGKSMRQIARFYGMAEEEVNEIIREAARRRREQP